MKGVLAAGCVALIAGTTCARADVVTEWNQAMLNMIASDNVAPPRASRAMAMVHVAQFEAVNSIDRGYAPYQSYYNCPAGTSKAAAAAVAAHSVMSQLFPTHTTELNTLLNSQLAAIPDGASKTDGMTLGTSAGSGVLALRASDNSNLSIVDNGSTVVGEWRPTGPAFQAAALPHWRYVTPWAVNSAQQFMAAPPPQLTSAQYTAAYNEVKELGSATSATRTAYQTDTAFLWRAGGNTVTPPGQWNQVAQQLASSHALTIDQSARMFALLGMSVADAGVTAWETKNTYDFWRPETGIQLGDTDFNAATVGDAAWQPLFVTPNHQSYTSGHSTFSSSAAAVLAAFFGSDAQSFTVVGDGRSRGYTSLLAAAQDAGQSRIYGGIHWQFDNQAGLLSGSQIGSWVFDHQLMPVPSAGVLSVLGVGGLLATRRRR